MSQNKVKSHWNERWEKIKTKGPTKKRDYYVSDYGRLKSVDKTTGQEFLLGNQTVDQYGFHKTSLRLANSKNQGLFWHRCVAEAFIPNDDPENKIYLVHIDQNKDNNHYTNIKWVTREELNEYQVEMGYRERDYRKTPSTQKMTESKVALLKKYLKAGKTKRKILAKRFDITETQIKRIERGENWGHVDAAE